MQKKRPISLYILFSALVAALGGFLVGYHIGIISGSLLFIAQEYQLSSFAEGNLVAAQVLGAVAGTAFGGFMLDSIGRKKTLQFAVALFLIGTLCLWDARTFNLFMIGRVLTGIAIGFAGVSVPVYIAEISPSSRRGSLVALYQVMITLGILASYIVSYAYAGEGTWRRMFAVGLVPAILQAVFLFLIPESPSWLISRGRDGAAQRALQRLKLDDFKEHKTKNSRLVVEEKKEDPTKSKRFLSFFKPAIRPAFFVGIGISVIQQITGINVAIYYMPTIFQMGGFATAQSAIYATMWVGVLNVIATLIGMKLVDKVGRRGLALCGLGGMAISLIILAGAFLIRGGVEIAGFIEVASLMAYIAFFAIGSGIVTFIIISEIFPLGIRGRAMGIAMFSNLAANYLVALSFLPMVRLLGIGSVFLIYAAICVLSWWFVWKKVPETRGKTFEEIQQFWHKN